MTAPGFYDVADKGDAVTARGTDGRPWDVEHGRTVVVCCHCSFAFDAVHEEPDGTYACPCAECPSNRGRRRR